MNRRTLDSLDLTPSRQQVAEAPATTQAEPTAPRPTSPDGRALDGWGLPLSGHARRAALEERGKPDPLIDPAAWAPAPAATEN